MCARRADRERRNAPQFRVQVEEITSQERSGKYLPAAAEAPTAGLAELMPTRPSLTGLLACRRGASHRSHVENTAESRKLLRRYHPGFGICAFFALHSLAQRHRSSRVLYSRIDKP